jgi:hypothetical protein
MASDGGTGRSAAPLAVVVVLLLVAGVAYVAWPRHARQTLVVGDSVTFLSMSSIKRELDPDRDLEIIAWPGFRSSDLYPMTQEKVREHKRDGDEIVDAVFLVGYNDVLRGDARSKDLDRMIGLSNRFECAIWLTIPARPGGRPAGDPDLDPDEVALWNRRMKDAAEPFDHVHVVDTWSDQVERSPQRAYLSDDGVHPVPPGERKLSRVMKQALDDAC